jgi:diadenosine tetraphosphate (Ap4A) HIT family hydrolase
VRHVEKAEAMALLEREARALPPSFGGCAMCGMVAGHPADLQIVVERPGAVVVLDRLANRRGHLLVVLRRHVESIAELPWSEYAEVQRLCWEAARALERTVKPRRVFVASLGSARQLTMSFPHHHVHVLPLFDGGEADRPSEVLTWRNGVFVYTPEEARALTDALRDAWDPCVTGSHPAPPPT